MGHFHGHDVIKGYPHAEIDGRPTTMVTVRLGVTRRREDDQSERKGEERREREESHVINGGC